jgi:hypothetical protein
MSWTKRGWVLWHRCKVGLHWYGSPPYRGRRCAICLHKRWGASR